MKIKPNYKALIIAIALFTPAVMIESFIAYVVAAVVFLAIINRFKIIDYYNNK